MDLSLLTVALVCLILLVLSVLFSVLYAQRQMARIAKDEIREGATRYGRELDRELRSGRDVLI